MLRRSFAVRALALSAAARAARAGGRPGRHLRRGGQGIARLRRHQLDLGDRRRLFRDVHAGRLRLPRDRLLARQERGHGHREDRHQLLDRRRSCTGRSASRSPSAARSGTSSAPTASSCATSATRRQAFPVMGLSDATIESKWFFQFVFCAVSLAIVWGTTLERIKFGVYVIYAVVFSALIYPIASGWVFGGGWLQANLGMQDFAGSTAVHLIGATGALAALLLLGPRHGKYGHGRQATGDPGPQHAAVRPRRDHPVARLVRVQPGLDARTRSTAASPRSCSSPSSRRAPACSARSSRATCKTKTVDIGMAGNGAIGALVAITAPSGYVAPWAGVVIGFIAGVIVAARRVRDRQADRRPGRRADGARPVRHLGHALVRHLHAAGAGRLQRRRRSGPDLHGLVPPARSSRRWASSSVFAFVFAASYGTFWVIKQTYGLRVSREEEEAGLDISEHGMYGYPEQFIPAPELVGYGAVPGRVARTRRRGDRDPQGGARMKKVEAYIRHEAFEPIRMELLEPRVPVADDQRGQGLRAAEGHHRALPRSGADELPAAEDQARVRRRGP